MKLSIVTSLYCSAPYVEEFHRRASAAARQLVGEDYEIVMVNDGSPDTAVDIAIELAKSDPHMVVVDLSRNFGHHRAMMAGLEYSQGERVFALDVDLEEDPELLTLFWRRMEDTHVDHVYGVQQRRKGKWFERWSGEVFYRLFNWLSYTTIPRNALMAKLMTRRFVNALLSHKERNIFLGGLLVLTGFEQEGIPCVKKCKGSTTYTFTRKLKQSIDSITSFSARPLYLIFCLGMGISSLSVIFLGYLLGRKLIWGDVLAGWTSVMTLISLGFGILTASIGVIGIYLSKIFEEVKHRPYVIVRDVVRHQSNTHKENNE